MMPISHRRRHVMSALRQLILMVSTMMILFPSFTSSASSLRKQPDSSTPSSESTPTHTTLSNSHPFPLIGVGAGNLQHQKIPLVINQALSDQIGTRLIDTSRSSSNEALVARAILRGMKQHAKLNHIDDEHEEHVVHVVTKVWYTHLGYERTNLSVRESLNDLSPILTSAPKGWTVKVHVLLQWPRCYDDIDWMDCEREEEELDEHTRSIGQSPLLNRESAWRDSWRALEELYNAGILESIGVSNFRLDDMLELLDMCTVKPHIYQGNLWNVVFDKELVDLIQNNGIFFQAFNVMNGVMNHRETAPHAYQILERIGATYSTTEDESKESSVSRLLLAWLVQRGIGVVAGASKQEHLERNSPQSIQTFPPFINRHITDVETAVGALLKGEDLTALHYSGTNPNEGVVTTFFNSLSRPVKLFLVTQQHGNQVPVSNYMDPGETNRIIANPGDIFVAYDLHGTAVKKFRVRAEHGQEERFSIQLLR